MTNRICSVDGCERPLIGRGVCSLHYQRQKRAGTLAELHPYSSDFDRLVAIQADDCVIWPHGRISGGYGLVVIDGNRHYVHRLACERGHGPMPLPQMDAAHSCGVRACMNPRHLRWATRAENEADKKQHGTYYKRGPKRWKLTSAQVDEIRAAYIPGVVMKTELAARYGVTPQHIGALILGRSRRRG